MNSFAAATARVPRSLWPASAMLTKRLGARIRPYSRLPSIIGNDEVVLAVHYKHRRGDAANPQIRAKLVLHEKSHRHEPIMPRADNRPLR